MGRRTLLAYLTFFSAAILLCNAAAVVSVATGHRETIEEAAFHARDLVARRSDGIATFLSVFPDNTGDGLDNLPIGGMEYVAPAPHGDLYILAMPVSKVSFPLFLCMLSSLQISMDALLRSTRGLIISGRVRIMTLVLAASFEAKA